MNLILKGLAALAVGLVVVASAEADGRRGRPAATTHYYFDGPSGPGYYLVEQPMPAARMHNGARRVTPAYGSSVPTYGWSYSPTDGWGHRWNTASGPGSSIRTYGWGYSPGKGWGFDWR